MATGEAPSAPALIFLCHSPTSSSFLFGQPGETAWPANPAENRSRHQLTTVSPSLVGLSVHPSLAKAGRGAQHKLLLPRWSHRGSARVPGPLSLPSAPCKQRSWGATVGSAHGGGGCWVACGLWATSSPAAGDGDGPTLPCHSGSTFIPGHRALSGSHRSPVGGCPGRRAPPGPLRGGLWARSGRGAWSRRRRMEPPGPGLRSGLPNLPAAATPAEATGAPGRSPGPPPEGKDVAAPGGPAANPPPRAGTHRAKPRSTPRPLGPAPPRGPGTVRVPAAPAAVRRLPRHHGAAPGPAPPPPAPRGRPRCPGPAPPRPKRGSEGVPQPPGRGIPTFRTDIFHFRSYFSVPERELPEQDMPGGV